MTFRHYFQCTNVADFDFCRECGVKNILVTYPRMKQMIKKHDFDVLVEDFDSVFIDSGSFSARRKGKMVDFDGYCEFLSEHQDSIDVAAQLDAPNDMVETIRNYRDHLDRGNRVCPVIDGDWEVSLRKIRPHINGEKVLLRWNTDIGDDQEDALMRLPRMYDYHCFAMGRRSLYNTDLIDSVDSLRWTILARLGSGLVWLDHEFESFNLSYDRDILYSFFNSHSGDLEDHGITIQGMIDRDYRMLRKFAIYAEYKAWFHTMGNDVYNSNFKGIL